MSKLNKASRHTSQRHDAAKGAGQSRWGRDSPSMISPLVSSFR